MPSDMELADSRGRPLHGRAREVAEAAEVRRRAEARHHSLDRALARVLLKLLAQPGGLSAPDALRRLADDPEDALLICEAAGLDPRAVRARWADAAPAAPAQSRSDFYSQFPDHHPDFLAGRRTLADVTAEYRERTAAKAARPSVMWRTRDGAVVDGIDVPMGASIGVDGSPQQHSIVHTSVAELGTEEV